MNLFIQVRAIRDLTEFSGFNKLVRETLNASGCRNYYSGSISVKSIFQETLHYCQIRNILAGALIVTLGISCIFYVLDHKNTSRIVALKRSNNKLHRLDYSWRIFLTFTASGYTFAVLTTLPIIGDLDKVLQYSMTLTMAVGIFAYGCRIVNHKYWSLKKETKLPLLLLFKMNYLLFPRSRLALISFILSVIFFRSLTR